MVRTVQTRTGATLKKIVDRIVNLGEIRRQEYLRLSSEILSDKITEEDRRQINRIFDYIQISRVKFID
jgi:hypothetical protein